VLLNSDFEEMRKEHEDTKWHEGFGAATDAFVSLMKIRPVQRTLSGFDRIMIVTGL
jgi:hypothetical protein